MAKVKSTTTTETIEFRAYHWGYGTRTWIPLGGLTRPTFKECRQAVIEHMDRWGDGPFEIRATTITEHTVSLLT